MLHPFVGGGGGGLGVSGDDDDASGNAGAVSSSSSEFALAATSSLVRFYRDSKIRGELFGWFSFCCCLSLSGFL